MPQYDHRNNPFVFRSLKEWEKDQDDVRLATKLATAETLGHITREEGVSKLTKRGNPKVYLKDIDKVTWW